MFCGNCGKKTIEGNRFCGTCGQEQRCESVSEAVEGASAAMKSPGKSYLKPHDQPRSWDSQQPTEHLAPFAAQIAGEHGEKPAPRSPKVLALMAAAVLVLGFGVFLVSRGSQGQADQPSGPQQSVVQQQSGVQQQQLQQQQQQFQRQQQQFQQQRQQQQQQQYQNNYNCQVGAQFCN